MTTMTTAGAKGLDSLAIAATASSDMLDRQRYFMRCAEKCSFKSTTIGRIFFSREHHFLWLDFR